MHIWLMGGAQDENEEMGRELAEGKVHELERGAALAKGFADDLRRAYASLEDHTHTLDRENEDLQVGRCFVITPPFAADHS
jgi:WTAP/Mum2p family